MLVKSYRIVHVGATWSIMISALSSNLVDIERTPSGLSSLI